ncbi:hypothetical protein PIB30_012655 [Stylosanthes scabra]|uniref:Ribonuclease H1 N-terminal domain-containing protein n=1 Tax=Stylosanthes scabra TaxID=79078 RepID=A0ABU6Z587_9FABA|nr:hypothetical protein [Stylosanthes scabra]
MEEALRWPRGQDTCQCGVEEWLLLVRQVGDHGRYPFYAVKRGRVPGVYRTWLECKRQVTGFRNNKFRGFHNRDEAEAWIAADEVEEQGNAAVIAGHVPISQAPQRLEIPRQGTSSPSYVGRSSSNNSKGSGEWENGRDDPRIPNEGPVMHMEDMELMLMRACAFFGVDPAMFVLQEITHGESSIVFGFTVILPNNERRLELVAHGTRSTNETAARQDAAFVMLEKLLSTTGYTICDYTHRIVRRVQEPNRNRFVEQIAALENHLRQLELENMDLKEQISFFQEILDE